MAENNFFIEVPIYPADIMVSLGQSREELIEAVKQWPNLDERNKLHFVDSIEGADDEFALIHCLIGTAIMIIHVTEPIKTPEAHGHLAHEIFHAVERIGYHIGLKHSKTSSEAYAYLISYITTEIYKRLTRD